MNFNAFSPSAKLVKSIDNISGKKKIGIISDGNSCNLVTQVMAGIINAGGTAHRFTFPEFGYLNRICPLTAQFGPSFTSTSARNLEALVKTQMLDGVVVIGGCVVTILGYLQGALKINTPILVLKNIRPNPEAQERGIGAKCIGFLKMVELLGMSVEGSHDVRSGTNAQIEFAYQTGTQIMEYATKTTTPRKLITKQNVPTAAARVLEMNVGIAGIAMAGELAKECGIKLGHAWMMDKQTTNLVLVRGSACEDGGIIQTGVATPPQFNGQAWVYKTLEDADRAISSGQVREGIVVLQNCVDIDVSIIALAIEHKGRAESIALATDGYCNTSNILTITHCTPSGGENGAFANIQTGDALEIDLAKGRFNTNVGAKDMRAREKRNSVTKPTLLF